MSSETPTNQNRRNLIYTTELFEQLMIKTNIELKEKHEKTMRTLDLLTQGKIGQVLREQKRHVPIDKETVEAFRRLTDERELPLNKRLVEEWFKHGNGITVVMINFTVLPKGRMRLNYSAVAEHSNAPRDAAGYVLGDDRESIRSNIERVFKILEGEPALLDNALRNDLEVTYYYRIDEDISPRSSDEFIHYTENPFSLPNELPKEPIVHFGVDPVHPEATDSTAPQPSPYKLPTVRFALFGVDRVSLKGNILIASDRYSIIERGTSIKSITVPDGNLPAGINPKGRAPIGSRNYLYFEGNIQVQGPVVYAGKMSKNVNGKRKIDDEQPRQNPAFVRSLPRLQDLLNYVPLPAISPLPVATSLENLVSNNLELSEGAYISARKVQIKSVLEPVDIFIVDSDTDYNEPIVVSCTEHFNPPSDFRIWYGGSRTIMIKPTYGDTFWGLIYAPNAKIIISPNRIRNWMALCGAVIGKEIFVEGNVRIELDLDLLEKIDRSRKKAISK